MSSSIIYTSEKALPYVYLCIHRTTKEFYIGFRCANKSPSHIDIQQYQTSSIRVRPRFDEFECIILAEFFKREDAYFFEQKLIYDNWNNSLILNKVCRHNSKRMFQVFDEATLKKMRKPKSDRAKINMGKARRGTPLSKEHCEKISKALTGKIQSRDIVTIRALSNTGKKRSIETCKNLSTSHMGHEVSQDTRSKISESVKNLPKITCFHCGKQNPPRNHHQWHGDKCKMKPTVAISQEGK